MLDFVKVVSEQYDQDCGRIHVSNTRYTRPCPAVWASDPSVPASYSHILDSSWFLGIIHTRLCLVSSYHFGFVIGINNYSFDFSFCNLQVSNSIIGPVSGYEAPKLRYQLSNCLCLGVLLFILHPVTCLLAITLGCEIHKLG